MTTGRKMKISTKILLMVCLTVTVIMLSLLGITIYNDYRIYEQEIADFEKRELEKVNKTLQNYVEMAYISIESDYNKVSNKDYLISRYGNELKNLIDTAESIIAEQTRLYNLGKESRSQARQNAINAIRTLRYDNGSGYVWINDTTGPIPKMVMHPVSPELNGVIMDDEKYNCALGTNENLFRAMLNVSLENGEGYVDYVWPKPMENGLSQDQPKLSYVRLISEWNWIIGTGIYIDDAINEARKSSMNKIADLRYDNGTGYFWINSNTEPFPIMIMHPISPGLNGITMDSSDYNRVKGTKQNLFQAMVDVCREHGEGIVSYTWPKPTEDGLTKNQPKSSYVKLFKPWGWIIGTGVYTDDIYAQIDMKKIAMKKDIISSIMTSAVVFIAAMLFGFLASLFIARSATRPLGGEPWQIEEIASSVARGRLIRSDSEEEKNNNKRAGAFRSLQLMSDKLYEILYEIKNASRENMNGSNDLSETAERLSESAAEQAALAEELSAAIDHISDTISVNSEKAALTKNIAATIETNLSEGTELMTRTGDSSHKIVEKINKIGDIARQTNILALNAAIEAARANQDGKGFAVVANEVKKLAQISSSTAAEIREISTDSSSIIKSTEEKILSLKPEIKQLTDFMYAINQCCEGEKLNIEQIKSAIVQLKTVVDQNAAASEELAGMAEELSKQTEHVNEKVSYFHEDHDKEKLGQLQN
jgi:methyl-accepting chemotaxis protein